MSKRVCKVTACDRTHFGLGYCQLHYRQFKKHGHVWPVGVHANTKGEEVAYRGAHRRIAIQRGKASLYFCADCNEQAQEWSLPPDAPNQLIGEGADAGKPYSLDVYVYEPRCIYHHRLLDGMPPVPGRAS